MFQVKQYNYVTVFDKTKPFWAVHFVNKEEEIINDFTTICNYLCINESELKSTIFSYVKKKQFFDEDCNSLHFYSRFDAYKIKTILNKKFVILLEL